MNQNYNLADLENLIDDVAKALTQIMAIHLFTTIVDGEEELFNEKLLKRVLYIVLGYFLYHLLIKRYVLKFKKDNLKKDKKKVSRSEPIIEDDEMSFSKIIETESQ